MTYMCEHCTNPGEHHVHTDRPHWLCDDCLDTLADHHDWQPVEEQTR